MEVPISLVKQFREELGATHLVLFAISEEGLQYVATHGKTAKNAKEAAIAGNNLKKSLGWEEILYNTKPLPRIHENCFYYKKDFGIHCFNGWSRDGSEGWCQLEPVKTKVVGEETACHFFEPKE
jgi:hypothetical protein